MKQAGNEGSKSKVGPDFSAPKPRQPYEFFRLNATYPVSPDSETDELLEDVGCFLGSVEETLRTMATELADEGSQMSANPSAAASMLWGAIYLTEMARNAAEAANRKFLSDRKVPA
ncbi:MAG: hypothetical protein NVS9B10_14980 [Nevskia sp.]